MRKKSKLKLKLFDKAKVIKKGSHEFPIGTHVFVTSVYDDPECPHYCCHSKKDFWFVEDIHLQKIEQ